MDWDRGHDERTAAGLVLAAQAVVSAAKEHAGDHILDVGCGLGNAALSVARAGARVTAVDPASCWRDAAKTLAERDGLELSLREGEAG